MTRGDPKYTEMSVAGSQANGGLHSKLALGSLCIRKWTPTAADLNIGNDR
jgi:hypothetical protein